MLCISSRFNEPCSRVHSIDNVVIVAAEDNREVKSLARDLILRFVPAFQCQNDSMNTQARGVRSIQMAER